MTKITKDTVLAMIEKNNTAVENGLIALYNNQTADELATKDTKHLNGKGFNGRDAKFGTDLAQQVIAFYAFPNQRKYNNPLSPNQLEKGRNMLKKYAGQLAKVANERIQTAEIQAVNAQASYEEWRSEAEAELAAERYAEDCNELAYIRAGYRDF